MRNDQVTNQETAILLQLAEQCLGQEGDFVELGCYRGDTSVLLGKLLQKPACGNPVENSSVVCGKPVQKLWIYDSFAGLPAKTPEDASGAGANFQKGELLVTKKAVVEKLRRAGLHQVIVKKAWFDDLTDTDLPTQVAFAFLDGDLYQSIKISLKLVAPRLVPGGVMVVHDYNNPELPGAARAVDEFLRAHPEYHLEVRHTLAILSQRAGKGK